jgi:two-component system response regulator YesN
MFGNLLYKINKKKSLIKRPFFRKNLASYSLLFSVPLIIIGSISYKNMLGSVKSQNVKQYNNIMSGNLKDFERSINEFINITIQFSQVGEFSEIIKAGNSGIKKLKSSITTINNCKNQLGVAAAHSLLAQNVVMHFQEEGLYFTTWGCYNYEDFFGNTVYFLDKKAENILKTTDLESYFVPVSRINTMGIVEDILIFCKTMPPYYNKNNNKLLFFISSEKLASILQRGNTIDLGVSILMDDQGNCIYTSDAELLRNEEIGLFLKENIKANNILSLQEINICKKKFILFSQKSNLYGLYYFTIVPQATVMLNTKQVKIQILMSIFILFSFGLLIAFILSERNSERIYDIVNLFFDKMKLGSTDLMVPDEFAFLKQNINVILTSNLSFETQIQQARPILTSYVLKRIITGNITSINNIQTHLSNIGLNFAYKYYLCVVLYKMEEIELTELLIKKIRYRFSKKNFEIYFVNIELLGITMLVNLNNNNQYEEFKDYLEKSINEIKKHLINNNTQAIAVGRIVYGLTNVYLSFQDCQEIIEDKIGYDNCPLLYYSKNNKKESEKNELFYHIPEHTDRKIVDLLMQCEGYKAFGMCKDIIYGGITTDITNSFVIQHIIYKFFSMAFRALKNMNIDYDIEYEISYFKETKNINKMLESVEKLFSEVCTQIKLQHESKKIELWKKIVDYVQKNFCDTQLTLTTIAEDLNVTPQYLCRYMKDHSGYTLLQYLNKKRIEYSKKLLMEGESIKNTVERAGFSSELTFRRQFKKFENITPGQFNKRYVK